MHPVVALPLALDEPHVSVNGLRITHGRIVSLLVTECCTRRLLISAAIDRCDQREGIRG
jgi:hypothetical protein